MNRRDQCDALLTLGESILRDAFMRTEWGFDHERKAEHAAHIRRQMALWQLAASQLLPDLEPAPDVAQTEWLASALARVTALRASLTD